MPPASSGDNTREASVATVEAVWRIEAARLIATLARSTGDVGRAEDMAQDALVIALEKWPATGVPDDPAAWLLTTARNRGIDQIRRDRVRNEKYGQIASELERTGPEPGPEEAVLDGEGIGDDILTLIFTACHPALSRESQVALTLKVVAGLSTEAIARAYLVPKPTIAQRLSRAKRTLTESEAGFRTPAPEELGDRLAAVLGVIYLIFNEGYAATAGDSWMRPELAAEAMRLGRVVAGLAPAEPEAQALVALMEIQASRFPARLDRNGEPILLMDQDRSRWDRLLVRRGLERQKLASELGGSGNYYLQASIAACHARAGRAEDTDWEAIVRGYEAHAGLSDSPVTELNRASALGMAGRPEEALAVVDRIAADRRMEGYYLLPAVRGDLLEKLGRTSEAAPEFELAAELGGNERERRVLQGRADSLKKSSA